MMYWIALLAALGVAVSNGIAAVLQKISADKQKRISSKNIGLVLLMLRDWPYLVGLLLDGLAWLLTLVAVHSLPLFVVQPIIALSVVVTALVERLFFRRKLGTRVTVAIICIVGGLLILSMQSTVQHAQPISETLRFVIMVAPLIIGAIGLGAMKNTSRWATITLAGLAGVAFGGTSIVGRMLNFSESFWRVFASPLFVVLLAYGIVGMVLFSVALQRNRASVVNSAMIAFETLVPVSIGIMLLGDAPKNGSWGFVVVGAAIALAGTLLVASAKQHKNETRMNQPTV